MRKDSFKVYLIIEGLNALIRVPVTTFICKNKDEARIYFEERIKNLPTSTYSLYEILDAEKEITPKKLFITSSLNIQTRQIPITEEYRRIKEAREEKEKKEIIKKLFDAKEVLTNHD